MLTSAVSGSSLPGTAVRGVHAAIRTLALAARLRLPVVPNQAQVPVLLEATTRAPGNHPRHTAVAPDVVTVYGYVEAPTEVGRKLRRGMVHAIRPPLARVARVLYGDALPVESLVARVEGYILVAHTLGYRTPPADDIVRGDVCPGVLKPVYGARIGALRYVNNDEGYHRGTPVGLGEVAAVGRPPDCSPIVGAALGGVDLGGRPIMRKKSNVFPVRV